MENRMNYTPEELEEMLEKAKKEAQMALDKMTPEERQRAEAEAQKLMEEDRIAKQKIIDEAAQFLAEHPPKESVKPKFCTNCGAKIRGGKFCEYCGSPL